MNKREDFKPGVSVVNAGAGSRRSRFAARGKRAKIVLNEQRLRAVAALARAANRAAKLRGVKCKACGKRLTDGALYCPVCGMARNGLVPAKAQGSTAKKPRLFRRVLAQLIDRVLTLPFLVLVYSGWEKWLWAAVAFHLLCDAFTGRSPGKWVCRIRVADARTLTKCRGLRAMLRRVGVAATQGAYSRWEWMPFALGYDLIAFLFLWRDPAGQRLEDKLLGTRVLGESVFRPQKWECASCGNQVAARARFCPKCGNRPKQA